ncbi:MAG TPA: crosslink repair DNA glycosylase YcaQ family protein, partial [Opitutaceae bacterium]
GRMHDLILRNRVAGYREGDLMRFLHGAEGAPPLAREERRAFEHHVPGTGILVAFPLEAWPHLLGEMQRRARRAGPWSGKLTPREKELSETLLAEIAQRGPLGSEDFDDERRARRVWGAAKLAKATLQKLFFHGRLLIAQRASNRRRYDLPERVLPPAVLAQPAPPAAETARWLALLKLRQRRLCALKRDELALVADAVQPVAVEGCPPLYCLRDDVPLLERLASDTVAPAPSLTRLLAPLDPLIYDRRVTLALWDFDYTWEVYTPPAKRVRGYYALPVLSGFELVGHVDPKADREAGRLRVMSKRIRRGHRVADHVREFARWLGLK